MTIRELLLGLFASMEHAVVASIKFCTELFNIVLFKANWLDAHWFTVLIAFSFWVFLVVSLINLIKKIWHRTVSPGSEISVTDVLVITFVLLLWLFAAGWNAT